MKRVFNDVVVRGDILEVDVNGVIKSFYVNAPVTKVVNGRYITGDRYATPLAGGNNWKVTTRGWNDQVYVGGHRVVGRV